MAAVENNETIRFSGKKLNGTEERRKLHQKRGNDQYAQYIP